jgi:nucleotide-binding universal stress UspA family protein
MKTILAAIDFSPATALVVASASSLARSVDGRVVLLNVTPPPPVVAEPGGFGAEVVRMSEAATETAIQELERLEDALEEDNIHCDIIHQTGDPVVIILEQARKLGAEYVVLGSHGHTALYDLIVGSTAGAILRHSPCPVVIVPRQRTATTRTRAPAARRAVPVEAS